MVMHGKNWPRREKSTVFAGHYSGHDDVLVWYWVYCQIWLVYGYPRCHWTPSSGKYWPYITYHPSICHGHQFWHKIWLVALCNWVVKICTSFVGHFWCPWQSAGAMPIVSLDTAGPGLPKMPLDVAIRQIVAPYCPGGCHGHQFCRKKSTCCVVQLLSKARVRKAQNGPSTRLIEATSCIEW